jgi:hypothetical protein
MWKPCLAKATHPQFVAGCKYHGTIGEQSSRPSTATRWITFLEARIARDISAVQPLDAVLCQRNTMKDLVRYVPFFLFLFFSTSFSS